MPLFEYKGLTAKGKQVSGLLEADGAAALRSKLQKDGVFVTSFKESGASGKAASRSGGRNAAPQSGVLNREVKLKDMLERVRQQDVAVLTRQFGTLLRAGISMSESLNALVEQQDRPKLKVVLGVIRGKVREGTSLADALAEHRKVFPDLYINMVRVGEASGTLDVVLERLADFLEAQVKLKSKITSAMIYPVLMMFVGVLIVGAMMVFVIPRVAEMFTEMGAELPFLTRLLIGMSWLFTHTWFIGIPAMAGGIWWFRKHIETERGRWWWDGLKLRMPVFGSMFRMVAVARFGRTLSTLLTSAVPVLSSLDIVRTIVNNSVLAKAIEDAKVAVREGESLAGPLEKSGLFPPMMTHMIAIGEKTGQLEGMLKNVADAYDAEVDSRVSTLTAVLEPVMIVGMGIMVAFLVFAILMPMMQMNEVITGK